MIPWHVMQFVALVCSETRSRVVSVGCNSARNGAKAAGGGRSETARMPRARNTPRRIGELSLLCAKLAIR